MDGHTEMTAPGTLERSLRALRVVPVVTIDDAADAGGLGRALCDGGLPVAEITFRTPAAAGAIALLRQECPDMLVGAGTILTIADLDAAVAAGASFVVTPGFNPLIVDRCLDRDIPIIPGISTPSDIEQGLMRGLQLLKFFPAEQGGGLPFLSAVAGPYPQVSFMPTGGINRTNLPVYLERPFVAACGGSWIAGAADIAAHRFTDIQERAREAVALAAPRDRSS
jgi:2-dehydro-3-deoxyphosphogluconate aldolase/(4S)-4-hydroxy-2-oxoglutarate aldolase